MLSWLIVGGGIHGTGVARALRHAGAEVRILDPTGLLLSRWNERAAAVGMTCMRSPVTHHLEDHETDLHHYAETSARDLRSPFRGRYKRPSLELFTRHCAQVIERYGLASRVCRGTARSLNRIAGGFGVSTDRGTLKARRVVLATGQSEAIWPAWAQTLRDRGAAIGHVLSGSIPHGDSDGRRWVVVGAGSSGLQVALRLIRSGAASVTIVRRGPLRIEEFDADQRWAKVKALRFWGGLDPASRARLLPWARHRGSVPPSLWKLAQREQRRQRLHIVEGEPRDATVVDGRAHLRLAPDRRLETDRVVLATGLRAPLARPNWLDHAIESLELPLSPGCSPALGPSLQWSPGLFVSGALAEQALGPVAPNLLGARWAARRIAAQS